MTKKKAMKEIMEWIGVILAAILFSFFINYCIIVNATVPSSSMETTIMTGDRVIGFRLSFMFQEPERGDIVMFKFPDNEKKLFIKRIIGMPGETLEVHDGFVYINGEPLNEPYLKVVTEGSFGPYKIPEGSYFMMGDNRNNSADSRYWENTYLKREKIVGKAVLKYFPSIEKLNQDH